MSPWLLAAWIGCQALDSSTTAVALRDARLMEGNPLLRGPHFVTMKISVNVGALLWQRQIDKQRPASAVRRVLPIVMAGSGCGAGALNLRTLHTIGR